MFKSVGWTMAALVVATYPAFAEEIRCGWLDNPTPANWFLVDRDEDWLISAQGGFQAEGLDRIPDLTEGEFVAIRASYGYACACMTVITDPKEGKILSIQDLTQLPLRQCQEDPALPQREPG
ncbi:MAG: DUF4087 domain-containing protein [Cyanobacteriota bacterium]